MNVTTALVAFTAFLAATGHPRGLTGRGRSLGYFVAAGVAENAGVFLIVLAYALWPSRRRQFDEAARMPLRED